MFDSFSVDWEEIYPYPVENFEEFYSKPFGNDLERATYILLEAFDDLNIKTTFFCVSHFAKFYPNILKAIFDNGHEIGTHTHTHRFLNRIATDAAKNEIYKSINILENLIGSKLVSFRAPAFSISSKDKILLEYLIEMGIKYDSSFFGKSHEYGGDRRSKIEPHIIKLSSGNLIELPISLYKFGKIKYCYSGGGYFRITPKNFIIHNINKLKKNNLPFIGYIHPRDIYKEQKVIINKKIYQGHLNLI